MSDITVERMKALAESHAQKYPGFDVSSFMQWFSGLSIGQRRFWVGRGVTKANKSRRMSAAAVRYME